MKKIILVIALAFGITTISAQKNNAELDSIINVFRSKYYVPAIATSVIKKDTILYGLSGLKRIGENEKIDTRSKFHLGSNTKAITSMIAAKLVEEGIIKWNTKLVDVVPELKDSIKKEYANITLEQLVSHRAKIHPFEEDTSKEWRGILKSISQEKDQKLSFANYALNLEPACNEKTNHIYSNGGYIIAALMLEKKSGISWRGLVDDLFNGLSINYYVGFPSQKDNNDTYGHKKRGKKYKSVLPDQEFTLDNYFAPAGNISLNIEGFSTFIQMHLKGLMGEDNILKSVTYQKLHFGFDKYALGWYNGNIGDTNQKFSYHGGSLGTFSSAVIISADREVAIVILVNADNKKVNQLKNELRVFLWGKYGVKN